MLSAVGYVEADKIVHSGLVSRETENVCTKMFLGCFSGSVRRKQSALSAYNLSCRFERCSELFLTLNSAVRNVVIFYNGDILYATSFYLEYSPMKKASWKGLQFFCVINRQKLPSLELHVMVFTSLEPDRTTS